MKPYQQVPIEECGEALVSVANLNFALESPHAYEKLGAPYGGKSPYFLRQGVLSRLLQAQEVLQQQHPGWNILIFDAYRPVAVQQFMVDYTFAQVLRSRQQTLADLSPDAQSQLWEEVYQLWAVPSYDPATPPPHSTGAAIDITLVDETGNPVDMGGEIDEFSDRSSPDYYLHHPHPQAEIYHHHRQILYTIMRQSGFQRHPKEWWHFSYGDQLWAWLNNQENQTENSIACYGRAEPTD